MNELEIFKNEEFGEVRVVTIDNEPWFVGKDVVEKLGYTDINHTILDHVDNDDRVNSKTQGQNNPEFGQRGTWLINESGLYSLVLSSKLPQAKKFKQWVTSEILPTIRKTGGYVNNDDLFISTYLPYADDITKSLFKTTLATVRSQNELIKKQQLELEQKDKDIEHKEDVIVGLVDDLELAEKRQILNRVVRYNHADIQKRWGLLYREFDNKYHIDIKRRMESYNASGKKPKVKSRVDYIDKVMGKIPELYEIATKIFETDVKTLIKEMYITIH